MGDKIVINENFRLGHGPPPPPLTKPVIRRREKFPKMMMVKMVMIMMVVMMMVPQKTFFIKNFYSMASLNLKELFLSCCVCCTLTFALQACLQFPD